MENFDETELNTEHKKKIQWTHIAICIIALSIFFIILSIILNKDEQDFLFGQINFSNMFSHSSQKENHTENSTVQERHIDEPTEPVKTASNASTALTPAQYEKIIHIYTQSPNKTVYLTFDDGPSPNVTPLILDELKKQNIKATFFMLGTNATYYPNLVKRAYEEGHYIANHGYSHKYSEIYQNTDTVLNDYRLCEQALKKALNNDNYQSKVYRFPGGSSGGYYDAIKKDAINLLKENNIAYLDWNALTYDAENAHTKESILENLANTVGEKNVVVLLMHDSSSKILTYDSLPDVINFFRERGYTFNTLYDALQ